MSVSLQALRGSIGQAVQKGLIGIVKGYRLFLSPWLGSACRFEPTCSIYSIQALETHGAAKGSYLTLKRLGRCHPWCEGGLDPVPQKNAESVEKPTFFSQLTSSSSLFKKLKKSS